MTKTGRLIGSRVVGLSAGAKIAVAALDIETGCDVVDIGLVIYPDPKQSEAPYPTANCR